MLGLVEPQSSGIGGGGFLLYYDAASRGITVYDGRETRPPAPRRPCSSARRPAAAVLDAVASGLSVGVPGAVALLETGAQGARQAAVGRPVRSSIDGARKGFPCRRGSPPGSHMKRFATSRRARDLLQRRRQSEEGRRHRHQSRTGRHHAAHRDGRRARLREGPIAEEMVARVRGHSRPGTWLCPTSRYKAIKREAAVRAVPRLIIGACRRPRPAASRVLQMLGLLEPFDLAQDRPNDLRAPASDRRGGGGSPSPTATSTSTIRLSRRCRRRS
jgi:gamma-glutamyltranspeptidase/glutathione hydrolase